MRLFNRPKWTASELEAFHTRNAQEATGPDADLERQGQLAWAKKARDGSHLMIGRTKAREYR